MLPVEVKDKFIELLMETGNVSNATKQLGINRMTAYGWRADPSFAQKWDMALLVARDSLKDKVLETACTLGLARPEPARDENGELVLDDNFEPVMRLKTDHVDVRVLLKLLDKAVRDEVQMVDHRTAIDGHIEHSATISVELVNPDGSIFLPKSSRGGEDVSAS